jgi:hypothetical protein
MREIRTSGLMSGDGKRGGAQCVSARAHPRLYKLVIHMSEKSPTHRCALPPSPKTAIRPISPVMSGSIPSPGHKSVESTCSALALRPPDLRGAIQEDKPSPEFATRMDAPLCLQTAGSGTGQLCTIHTSAQPADRCAWPCVRGRSWRWPTPRPAAGAHPQIQADRLR